MPIAGGPLVLVASPDEPFGTSLRGELEALGCQVVAVSTVIDAITELHGLDFDLAFIAHSLSTRPGASAVRVAHELSPDTEVVVILDDGREDAPVEYVRLGAFDFLHQPLRPGELETVLQRAIEWHAERTSNAIYRASHAILGGTKPEQLPQLIVSLAADILGADGVVFLRLVGDRFEPGERAGFSREETVGDLTRILEQVPRDTLEPILLPDDRKEQRLASRIRSAIAVPIVIDGQLTGLLAASRSNDPRPFRRGDTARMTVLASKLHLAIENARLVEKTISAERLAAIGELAAGVAHEIASPLTYVLGNVTSARDELGQPDFDADELRRMLDDIKDGAERIRDIARDLKTLARGSAVKETFDLANAAKGALRIAGPTVRGALKVETSFVPDALVSGSPGRLTQVFINLLVNAAQAAKTTGRIVRLEIETRKRGDRLLAIVRDEGPGIPPHQLGRIFDPFFTTKSADNGTGLGLAITRSIIEAHGGTIEVASELGRGTSFTIDLPLVRPTELESSAAA